LCLLLKKKTNSFPPDLSQGVFFYLDKVFLELNCLTIVKMAVRWLPYGCQGCDSLSVHEDPRTVPVMQACIDQTAGVVFMCVYKRVV